MFKEESSKSLIVHLIIVGFHHKKGHQVFRLNSIELNFNKIVQIEYSYPLLNEPIDERWSNLPSLALPDGAHNREKDLIYFHIPSIDDDHQTLFGVAAFRQIDADVRKDILIDLIFSYSFQIEEYYK